MTNQALRKRASLLKDVSIRSNLGHSYEDAVLRLLDEHARMKAALEYYADGHNWLIRGDGSQAATRDEGKTARTVLDSLKQENP